MYVCMYVCMYVSRAPAVPDVYVSRSHFSVMVWTSFCIRRRFLTRRDATLSLSLSLSRARAHTHAHTHTHTHTQPHNRLYTPVYAYTRTDLPKVQLAQALHVLGRQLHSGRCLILYWALNAAGASLGFPCTSACVRARVHACVYVHECVGGYVCMRVYVCLCVCVFVCVCVCVCE